MTAIARLLRTLLALTTLLISVSAIAETTDPWASVPGILARIVPPGFPSRDFVITKFGALDGADVSEAIAKAIDACARAGGGHVIVPKGDYITGPIHLKSHVDLHIEAGATLRFSQDPSRYPLTLTRWEGVELMNYAPLISALDCEDIAITGEGTLDGQADAQHWWNWKPVGKDHPPQPQLPDRTLLFKQAEEGVPVAERVYGPGHFLRP